jgi:hypothetical protein
MEVRVRTTGAVMLESDFRFLLSQTGGPTYDVLTPEVADLVDADPVFEGTQPVASRYQTIYRNGVEQIKDQWFTKYSLSDMDSNSKVAHDLQEANLIRKIRNGCLSGSDWTQLADAPVDDLAWAKYRQELRNIPSQVGFPWDVVWPAKP